MPAARQAAIIENCGFKRGRGTVCVICFNAARFTREFTRVYSFRQRGESVMKPQSRQRKKGFTLVEIMIAVVIVGLLCAIAIPAFVRVRQKSEHAAAFNDLRVFANAFQDYAMEYGDYPLDKMPGEFPPEMEESSIRPKQFTKETPVGGLYDWEGPPNWTTIYVSIRNSVLTGDADRARKMDKDLDDGNLSSGTLRYAGGTMFYFIEDYTGSK